MINFFQIQVSDLKTKIDVNESIGKHEEVNSDAKIFRGKCNLLI